MAGGRGTATRLIRAAALGCGCGLLPGQAQEDAGGLVLSATVSPRLEWSDNLDFTADGEAGFRASTALSFALESTTRVQQFALSAGGALRYDDSTGEAGFEDPQLRLFWRRESRDSAVEASVLYREADVSSLVAEDEFDPDSLILDDGTRRTLSADVALEFGRESPFGGRLALSHDRTEYLDTTDPELVDTRTDGASLDLRFAIDPRISARAALGWTREDSDGDTDTETLRASAGAGLEVSPVLTVGADIGWSRIERTGLVTDTDEGLSLGLDATWTLANGSLSGSIDSEVGENGRRSEIRVSRALEMPRGQLTFSVGASRTEGFDVEPLLGLDYVQELPRGVLTASLEQRTDTDDDGEESLLTSLSLGYRQELTAVSSLGASASLRSVDVLAAGGDDASRIDLSLSYTHALTDEWGLTGGYTRALSRSDAEPDVSANTVFLGLERNFRWRP
jgi:hypothetical protein